MAFKQIFAPLKRNSPVRLVANYEDNNKIRNILNDLQGVNCRVEKPDQNQGLGWRIVVGDGTDVERPPNIPEALFDNIFIAQITASASGWTFTEYEHTGAGTFAQHDAPLRTGVADEINGINSPAGGYTFLAYVFESGNGRYSFAMPIQDGDVDDVFQIDSNGVPSFAPSPIFPAYITNTGSAWDFDEYELTASGLSFKSGGRTGTAKEFNGYAAPSSGTYQFYAMIIQQDDAGSPVYYFEYPTYGTDKHKSWEIGANGVPEQVEQHTFVGKVYKNGSAWNCDAQYQTASGFADASTRQNLVCRERNGLNPPASGTVSFYTEVTESFDTSDNPFYSFNLPIHELGTAYQLLRIDSTGNNWEWGCAEIT